MSSSTLPFGTAMALAQRTMSQPLTTILAAHDLEPGEWFTLNALGLQGGKLPSRVVFDLLATNGYDDAAASAMCQRLADAGQVTPSEGQLVLTESGRKRYESVRARVDLVTQQIFERFDANQVENARALLQEMAELDPEALRRLASSLAR